MMLVEQGQHELLNLIDYKQTTVLLDEMDEQVILLYEQLELVE